MVHLRRASLLAGVASLLLVPMGLGQTLTDAEFKCQAKTNKAGAKFVDKKAKCASKCIQNARKVPPVNPITDCYAPYAGATAECVNDTVLDKKGVEDKFRDAILKACDPATKPGTDCPECYSGGDCSAGGEAGDRVQNIEGQVDSFGPGVFCDQDGSNPPNADAAETACEFNTAKSLSKLVKAIDKCYDKCQSGARKVPPTNPLSDCTPPGAGTTGACISAADAKAVASVNKKCRAVGESTPGANDGTTAVPDCVATNDYPDGASWVNLVDLAISGTIPGTYCGSPSGAFVD